MNFLSFEILSNGLGIEGNFFLLKNLHVLGHFRLRIAGRQDKQLRVELDPYLNHGYISLVFNATII
jgi:hypothetical protein